jgi:Soluble lytic murein transglycosylase and related regulatory proteins (some contain LysM/invasin domains)
LRYLALLLFASSALACGYPDPKLHARVEYWARTFGLDPLLLGAVVWVESRYCAGAIGQAGEIGLGQVKPTTALDLGVDPRYLHHPDHNLYATARYLRELYLAFGDWTLALAAYNRGPGRVRKEGVDAKGQAYVKRVLAVYTYWKRALAQRKRGGSS